MAASTRLAFDPTFPIDCWYAHRFASTNGAADSPTVCRWLVRGTSVEFLLLFCRTARYFNIPNGLPRLAIDSK